MFYRLTVILFALFALSGISCRNQFDVQKSFYGVHNCYVTDSGSKELLIFSDTVRLEFLKNEYKITGKNRYSYGYGSWATSGDSIVFNDKMLRSGFLTGGWVLDGSYAAEINGEKIFLTKNSGQKKCEYLLSGI